jgi:hypothetical protein
MTVGRSTLDRWIVAYRAGGFDALVPAERRRQLVCDVELLDLAVRLKRENPARTATHIVELIVTDLAGQERDRQVPSARTVQRHFARLGLNVRPTAPAGGVRPVRSRQAVNDLWVGDVAHGPEGRRPQGAAVRVHGRPLPADRRPPVGPSRGRAPARSRPAARARVPGCPSGSTWTTAARSCRTSCSASARCSGSGSCTPAPAARKDGEDRTVLRHRPGPVPGRDRRRPARPRWRSSTGCSPPGSRPATTTGPTAKPPRRRCSGSPPPASPTCPPRACCGKRSCGPRPAPSPRPRWCRCTATATRSTPRWSAVACSWCSTRSTSATSRSATTAATSASRSRTNSRSTCTPRPPPSRPTCSTACRRPRPGSTTSRSSSRAPAGHPPDHQLRRPRPRRRAARRCGR